jgi:hypothetical protein
LWALSAAATSFIRCENYQGTCPWKHIIGG